MYVCGKLHFTNWVHIFFTKLLICQTPSYYKLCNTYANDLTALIKTYNYEVFILNFDILGFRIILHCYEVAHQHWNIYPICAVNLQLFVHYKILVTTDWRISQPDLCKGLFWFFKNACITAALKSVSQVITRIL